MRATATTDCRHCLRPANSHACQRFRVRFRSHLGRFCSEWINRRSTNVWIVSPRSIAPMLCDDPAPFRRKSNRESAYWILIVPKLLREIPAKPRTTPRTPLAKSYAAWVTYGSSFVRDQIEDCFM